MSDPKPLAAPLMNDEPQIWVGSPEWVRREEEKKVNAAIHDFKQKYPDFPNNPVSPLPEIASPDDRQNLAHHVYLHDLTYPGCNFFYRGHRCNQTINAECHQRVAAPIPLGEPAQTFEEWWIAEGYTHSLYIDTSYDKAICEVAWNAALATKAVPIGEGELLPAVVTSNEGVVEGIFTSYDAALEWAKQHQMGVANVRGGVPFEDVRLSRLRSQEGPHGKEAK